MLNRPPIRQPDEQPAIATAVPPSVVLAPALVPVQHQRLDALIAALGRAVDQLAISDPATALLIARHQLDLITHYRPAASGRDGLPH